MSNVIKKDRWDKFQIVANLSTNFFATIVIVVIGFFVSSTLAKREANTKMVEVAVGVLQVKPDETNKGLRAWAINVVNKYSEVPLSNDAQEELKTNSLPRGNFLTTENGKIITTEDGKAILLD